MGTDLQDHSSSQQTMGGISGSRTVYENKVFVPRVVRLLMVWLVGCATPLPYFARPREAEGGGSMEQHEQLTRQTKYYAAGQNNCLCLPAIYFSFQLKALAKIALICFFSKIRY